MGSINIVSVGIGSEKGVVTKDVADYSIVAGVPARLLRKRFDEETIRRLLEIRWWDFPDSKLHHFAQFIKEPKLFISEVDKQ